MSIRRGLLYFNRLSARPRPGGAVKIEYSSGLIQRRDVGRMGADVFVDVIAHVDRRRRALGAIQAFAGPATDADIVKAVAPFQIDGVGINEFLGVAQFAADADRQEAVRHGEPDARLADGAGAVGVSGRVGTKERK